MIADSLLLLIMGLVLTFKPAWCFKQKAQDSEDIKKRIPVLRKIGFVMLWGAAMLGLSKFLFS
jgi:hypothetical protein